MKSLLVIITLLVTLHGNSPAALPIWFQFEQADAVVIGSLGKPTGKKRTVSVKIDSRPAVYSDFIEFRLLIQHRVRYDKKIILPSGKELVGRDLLRGVEEDGKVSFVKVLIEKGMYEKHKGKQLWFLSQRHDLGGYVAVVPTAGGSEVRDLIQAYEEDEKAKKEKTEK